MNTITQHHIDEKAILMAIVDKDRLTEPDRRHLSACSQCRSQKENMEQRLAYLGERAKKLAPLPQKRPVMPPVAPQRAFFRGLSWKPALVGALTIVMVIAVSLWTMVPEKNQTLVSTENKTELWEEEQLMLETDLFAENTLPGEYAEIISESDVDFEEAFLEYIAPLADSQPLSLDRKKEGGPLC